MQQNVNTSRYDRVLIVVVLRNNAPIMDWNFPRPGSSTLGQVERFSWTDPLFLTHLCHVDLKTPLFLTHLTHVDLETRFYLFHLTHLCQLNVNVIPTVVIPFLEKSFSFDFFFKIP